MKPLSLIVPLFAVSLAACQSKPQGETIPLPPAPVQATEQNLKSPTTTAETGKAQDDENSVYHKPVKIKVKRDGKDNYTWELTGDSVKEILVMDRELRKKLLPEDAGKER